MNILGRKTSKNFNRAAYIVPTHLSVEKRARPDANYTVAVCLFRLNFFLLLLGLGWLGLARSSRRRREREERYILHQAPLRSLRRLHWAEGSRAQPSQMPMHTCSACTLYIGTYIVHTSPGPSLWLPPAPQSCLILIVYCNKAYETYYYTYIQVLKLYVIIDQN